MASTPVQGFYVPSTGQAPATAADLARMAGDIELRSVLSFPDAAARDVKIPVANRLAGMVCYVQNLGYHMMVPVNGGAWQRLANPPESFIGGEQMMWGSSPTAGTFVVRRCAHQVLTTNASGDTQISVPPGITSGVHTVIATSGDIGVEAFIVTGMANATTVNIRAAKAGAAVPNASVRVMIEVRGW